LKVSHLTQFEVRARERTKVRDEPAETRGWPRNRELGMLE
jgi:hypothetical protein